MRNEKGNPLFITFPICYQALVTFSMDFKNKICLASNYLFFPPADTFCPEEYVKQAADEDKIRTHNISIWSDGWNLSLFPHTANQ